MTGLPLVRFAGVFSFNGAARRVTLEATSIEEARAIADRWSVGITGEEKTPAPVGAVGRKALDLDVPIEFLTYTVSEVEAVLKVSRPTVYRLIARRILRPVPGIRHKLIPREQVLKFVSGSGLHGKN